MVKAEIKYYLTAWDCNGTPLKQVRVIVSPIETLSEFLTDKKKRIDYLKKIEGCVNLGIWLTINKKTNKEYNIRDLYDFFDEQGIYCFAFYFKKRKFKQHIETKDNIYPDYDTSYKTRQEAEQAMFLIAFEILEEQLKNKEK